MRLKVKRRSAPALQARLTKKVRIRKKVSGTADRPRLCIYRSGRNMYAQLVDDNTGRTIMATSSLKMDTKGNGKEIASAVGKAIGKISLEKSIKSVVFDRNGFIYHGRVKALADGAREAGLNF